MSEIKKGRGRPAVNSTPITLRLAPALLSKIDALRSKQSPIPSRPEAIRQILEARLMEPEE